MTDEALQALQATIARWEAIRDGTFVFRLKEHCPLCVAFWGGGCLGCPVYQSTGQIRCEGTPYKDWRVTRSSEDAQREVEFLRSLLP